MGLVGAEKLAAVHPHDGHGRLGVMLVIQPALNIVQVHDSWVGASMRHLVDFLQPFHLAVAVEWIVSQKKLWQGCCCKEERCE